ncbi:RNA polymerase sigma factor [Tundrisphaera lichenicola]|uniref:RNA polymerase sigma factor n=1 Tax=Tundrisphaera lichenicola TaxID=2029860 RepID=UPI003EBDCD5D
MKLLKGRGVTKVVRSSERVDPGETAPSLVGALIAGDQARWSHFVEIYGPFIRFCASLCRLGAHDADDVVQAVLVKVATRASTFHGDVEGATFRGWVWTIAYNESIKFLRDAGRHRALSGDLGWVAGRVSGSPDDSFAVAPISAERELMERVVERALAEFAPASRERLMATLRDGRLPADVAADHGVSVGSIWTLRSRFRARVLELWNGVQVTG